MTEHALMVTNSFSIIGLSIAVILQAFGLRRAWKTIHYLQLKVLFNYDNRG
jgi:hypothetical protein